jgi:uncharacterized protein
MVGVSRSLRCGIIAAVSPRVLAMTHFATRSYYATVAAALSRLESDIDAAECHGMLCGLLCSPTGFETSSWLQHLTGYQELTTIVEDRIDETLNDLLQATVRGIDSDEYLFELLLPDDDEPLMVLGGWCRGFLSGFGASTGAAALSNESQEYLSDLYRISQVDAAEPDTELGEHAFQEIVEYARMGAILLREENRQVIPVSFESSVLH